MMSATSPPLPVAPQQASPDRGRAAPGAYLALGLLLGINLFNYIDRQVLAALLTPIEEHFLPEGDENNGFLLGLLASAFLVSYMIFAPLFGWLADRMSRWWLIGLGVIIWSAASGGSGLAGLWAGMLGFWVLLATRCFVGIGEAAYGPAAPAVLSDLFPVRIRGQVMAWFYVAIPVGSALGYALGGVGGWPWAFYLVVPPGLLLGLLCFFMPEPARGQTDLEDHAAARHITLRDYRRLFRNPSYVLDTAGMACLTFAMGGIAVWVPFYLEKSRHLGSHQDVNLMFGAILVVAGLVATLLGGLAGDWARKYHSGSYFLVSALAMFLSFPILLAVIWAPNYLIWPLIFLTCFFLFFNMGPTNTILANVTHPSLRAPAFALNIFIIHALGDVISPPAIGKIAGIFGTRTVQPETGKVLVTLNLDAGFVAVSIVLLLGSLLWLIGARYLGRDTERAIHQLDD